MIAPLLPALVMLGGALGAALRHLADSSVPERVRARFPWGIMWVNIVGSFGAACCIGVFAVTGWESAFVISGFFGGFTTFSTASLDTTKLLIAGRMRAALGNSIGMLAACTLAAILGWVLTASVLVMLGAS